MVVDWLLSFLRYLLYSYLTVRLMKFSFVILKSLHMHFVLKPRDLSDLLDSWTVITGGTDGIGKAYCYELARARGVKRFYLIGRNEKKLEAMKADLEAKFGCEVRTAIFDFETDDTRKLPAELYTLDVGILLNCAGIAPQQVGALTDMPPGLASKILRVNLESNVTMIEAVLPGMVKRNKGIIVNVASMTGWRPLPYISFYPASKAAISFFSEGLADEYAGTGVSIQCLVPMLVATKVASYDAAEANDIFVISTENFAKQAVRIIGNVSLACGCWQHDFQIAIGALVSPWLFKKVFVPTVMLGVHKQRVADYASKHA